MAYRKYEPEQPTERHSVMVAGLTGEEPKPEPPKPEPPKPTPPAHNAFFVGHDSG